MSEATCLPWLGLDLDKESDVAGVSFLPWSTFKDSLDLPDAERAWLDKYFGRYRERNCTTAVSTITIAQPS